MVRVWATCSTLSSRNPQKPLCPWERREEYRLPLLGVLMLGSLRLLTGFLVNVGFWWIMPQVRREMRSTVWYESMHGLIHLLILPGCGSFDRLVSRLKKQR